MAESSKDVLPIFSAITGMVLGTAGFVLSLVNYFRDRAKITVLLEWDSTLIEEGVPYDHSKKYAVITVTNVGRRPVYLKSISLQVPMGRKYDYFPLWRKYIYLISRTSIAGKKLEEGSQPMSIEMDQGHERLAPYSNQRHVVRAAAQVSTGKTYLSKKMRRNPIILLWGFVSSLPITLGARRLISRIRSAAKTSRADRGKPPAPS